MSTRRVRRVGGVCVGAWRGGGGANQGLVSFAALTKAHPVVTPFGFLHKVQQYVGGGNAQDALPLAWFGLGRCPDTVMRM